MMTATVEDYNKLAAHIRQQNDFIRSLQRFIKGYDLEYGDTSDLTECIVEHLNNYPDTTYLNQCIKEQEGE